MKSLILSIILVLASSAVYAADKEVSFEDQKKESLQMVDEHTAAVQAAKTCLTAAADKGAIEKCESDLWKAEKKCKDKCKKCHLDKKDK